MDRTTRFLTVFCLILVMTFVIQATVYCQESPTICDERITLNLTGGYSKTIPYCRNYSLEAKNASIARAVIVIHGVDRNAGDYYNYIWNAAQTAGALNETIIIAPQFLLQSDLGTSVKDVVAWADEGEGWSRGDNSCTDDSTCNESGVGTISSFSVIDTILQRLSDRGLFPSLSQIIIAGHSAGGQFVNRFAAGSQAEVQVVRKHIKIRYIVSNPSSYLYFSEQRWDDKSDKPLFQFKVPDPSAVGDCPYNDYRYGLENLNSYMAATGIRKIPHQYRQRKVVYLLGGSDTDGPNLDTGCAANFQGSFRLLRGYVYYNYLSHFFQTPYLPNQSLVTVPGVAHDADAMFNSACGLTCLFDTPASTPPACGHICGH
jgi:hypothetical protein